MNVLLYLLIFATLAIVCYQDFKAREVWIWLFVFFFIESILFSFQNIAFKSLLLYSAINLCIITFQCIVLTGFFSLKNKRFTNIINSYIGIGDIIFFCIVSFWFSPF